MNILITGAAQGIGAETARLLANEENNLILVDLLEDKLQELALELTPKCSNVTIFPGNLADETFVSNICSKISELEVNVLVNNAAIAHKLERFEELTVDTFDLSYNINVKTPFRLMQAAIKVMNKVGKGSILNIASRANIYGYGTMGIYASTKAAITSFTGTVALENENIKAVTVIPGRTNTKMQADLRGSNEATTSQSPEYVASIISQVITEEIEVESGEIVIIDFGEYKVIKELDRQDLHKNMH